MSDLEAVNGTLPLWVQLPASALLAVILLLALRFVKTRNARFVVFACWLRFMLSAFHVYTFQKVLGPLSVNALGSAGLFTLGLLLLPRTLLLSKAILSAYAVLFVIVLSAFANGTYAEAFEPVVKFGLFIVIALNCYQALRTDDERRFGIATLLSFSPLLVFQAISLMLNVSKSDPGTSTRNFIGGYDHEAAFSVALVGLFTVAAVSRAIPLALKVAVVPVAFVSILLANYRTSILAMVPLVIYFAMYGISRFFSQSLRPLVVTVSAFGLVLVGGTSLFALDRFSQLRTIIEAEQPLIQPPDDFTRQDRELLTGRSLIWSSYYYRWKDEGGQVEHLVGFGPDSWKQYFRLYAHNSFVDFLFEYGVLGVIALFAMIASGLMMAWNTGINRWRMVSAHMSFLALNLATMPMWLVEGLILYGLLWGYTMFYRALRFAPNRVVEEQSFRPAVVA